MFSQFIDGDRGTAAEVAELSILMVVVVAVNYVLWTWIGSAVRQIRGPMADWIQQYGFGGLLMLVGFWLLLH